MPVAPVDQDDLPMPGEYDVGLAGERLIVESIAESHSVDHTSDSQLGLRVLIPDPRHSLAAFLGGHGVGHETPRMTRDNRWDSHDPA